MSRHNPNISSFRRQSYFDSSRVLSFKEYDLRFAFNIEGYLDDKVKDDPNYVKYLVRMYGKKDGVPYEKILEHHKCSAEELRAFKEPMKDTQDSLQRYIDGTDRHLYCMSWDELDDETLSLWGTENDDNYQRWEFNLLPCNYVHKQISDIGDGIHSGCIAN